MDERLDGKLEKALDALRAVRDNLLELAKAAIHAELYVNDLLVSLEKAEADQIAPQKETETDVT